MQPSRIPDVAFHTRVRTDALGGPNPDVWKDVTSADVVAGQRVVLFAVPAQPLSRSAAQGRAVPSVAMMLSKTDFRSAPRPVTALRMKVDRIAPISAYSMAVAPRRQAESREIRDRR